MNFLDHWEQSNTLSVDGQQSQRLLASLSAIATLMRQVTRPDDACPAFLSSAVIATGADSAALRIADIDRRVLTVEFTHGFDRCLQKVFLGRTMSVYDSQSVLSSSFPIGVDLHADLPTGFPAEEFRALRRFGATHAVIVPLFHRDVLVGRLDLMTGSGAPFGETERAIAEALGPILASGITDVLAGEDRGGPVADPEGSPVQVTPPVIEGISTVREMYQYLVDWIDDLAGPRQCYGFLWDSMRSEFSPMAVAGSLPPAVSALKRLQLRPERVLSLREALHASRPYEIPNPLESSLFPERMAKALNLCNVVMVPLRSSRWEPIGALLLDFEADRALGGRFLNMLEQASLHASKMLENALLYEAVQRSSETLAIVNEIGIEIASLTDLSHLFRRVFYHIRSVMETSCFAVGLLRPDRESVEYRFAIEDAVHDQPVTHPTGRDALSWVIQNGRSQLVSRPTDIRRANWFPMVEHGKTIKSIIAVPVVVGREIIGVMTAQSESQGAYTKEELDLMRTVGMQLGAAIQNARLYAIVQARGERRGFLLDQVISRQEAERKILVDDIHDHTLQTLAHVLFQLDLTSQRFDQMSVEEAQEALGKVREMLAENIERLREIIFQLRPSTLDILGLEPAIREYFKHFERDAEISTSLQADLPDRLPGDVETKVYRFIQEAVDSVRHRPEVTRVGVRIRERGSTIIATIADNGRGFDPAVLEDASSVRSGLSDAETRLLTLKERAEMAGGNLRVKNRSGGGAMVQVVIPNGRSDV